MSFLPDEVIRRVTERLPAIGEDAAGIRDALARGVPVVYDYWPGDWIRYSFVFTPLGGKTTTVRIGDRTLFAPYSMVVASLPDFGRCYPFDLLMAGSYFSADYVGEKLFPDRLNSASPEVVALLFNLIARTWIRWPS